MLQLKDHCINSWYINSIKIKLIQFNRSKFSKLFCNNVFLKYIYIYILSKRSKKVLKTKGNKTKIGVKNPLWI